MSVPSTQPAPAMNRTAAGFAAAASDVTGSDILYTVGDYTGGATAHMFTLTAHGLATGDYLFLLYKSAAGTVTGRAGTKFRVKIATANVFQLTDLAGTVIENTADGNAVFLKGTHATSDAVVQNAILPRLIVAAGVYTGGTTEDMFTPVTATGFHNLEDTDTLKLLYKAAAGVLTGISANTTVFAKSTTATAFETAASSGGADIENTADGVAIFLKTS
jgi:hypothetical protein